ncbi:F420-dependent thioredoxin reductase [Methanofervidicoccus abyssi]|uniref:Thioredoxin reductase (NADPH) n=1 Tax=Methanofervidicoccus abyssi TaxID=2082189 RepID=A0A401HQP7_9EURY|nr:F420-dependent thioredoxin reductase [Methanofervidicoccus abyssi]GBF36520.1 thioredoxin reductase (NADPH) [Methanofervidicoccus abyssi]
MDIYDVVIIGGGPAGLTAGIYAMRAKLKTVCIEKEREGGKIAEAGVVENYPGFEDIKGYELAERFVKHAKKFNLEIVYDTIVKIDTEDRPFKVIGENNTYITKSVVIATGTREKKLGLNEDEFIGKGVSYCTTCDAFFYLNKDVIVIGRDTPAVMSALNLKDIAKKVTVITDKKELKSAERIMLDRLKDAENIDVIKNAKIIKILGEEKAEGVLISLDGEERVIKGDGIFISMGHEPNSQFLEGSGVELINGFVKVDRRCRTNIDGIFACGDITGGVLQVSKAVGEGAVAMVGVVKYLNRLDKN